MKTCSFTTEIVYFSTFFGNTGKLYFRTLIECCVIRLEKNVLYVALYIKNFVQAIHGKAI